MATQVEPLLPGGAPLLQAEEHGGLVRKKPPPPPEGKGEPGANDVGGGEPDGGARRPRPPCSKPLKEGTGQPERESPRPPQLPGVEGLAFSDGEEGGGGEPGAGGGAAGAAGAGRRDFVEAPPPKVNPWTKNALPPVLATVNGQSPPGGSPRLLSRVLGPLPGTQASPPPEASRAWGYAADRGDSGFFFFFQFLTNSGSRALRIGTLGNLCLPECFASGRPRPPPGPQRLVGNGVVRAYLAGSGWALVSVKGLSPP